MDRRKQVVGLTLRVGRHVHGVAEAISYFVHSLGSQSMLLLGRPGVGKTSLLRDITKQLADVLKRRVIVVDTSNEIAGDGPVTHECIGRARRMQVDDRIRQHNILIEAVQNHNPEVIVIDEVGTPEEVQAVKTIAQRGICMVDLSPFYHFFSLFCLTLVVTTNRSPQRTA